MWKLHDDTKCGCVDKRRPETLADNPDSPVLVECGGTRCIAVRGDAVRGDRGWFVFKIDGAWAKLSGNDAMWTILHDDSATITVDGKVRG